MNPPERIAKLPQWAQREIQLLQMRLDEARAEIAARDRGDGPFYRPGAYPEPDKGLGVDSVIASLNEGAGYEGASYEGKMVLTIKHDRHDEPYLEVYGTDFGHLRVEPQSSNVVRISQEGLRR